MGCVPRASGDEPRSWNVSTICSSVFPARAGMNRFDRAVACHHRRVPRASGDEPVKGRQPTDAQKCSPRERG